MTAYRERLFTQPVFSVVLAILSIVTLQYALHARPWLRLVRAQGGLGNCPANCPQTCGDPGLAGPCVNGATGAVDFCAYPGVGCASGYTANSGCCCDPSPILIDVNGDGFALSDVSHGVRFEMGTLGQLSSVAWPLIGSDDAWLALDRNGDGKINNVTELFGNYTPQPASASPNGFIALAVFDRSDHGGNEDGVIDERDKVFADLRLWQDSNHNGISEPEELHTLSSLRVQGISLSFEESKRVDQYGNAFRYRARVWGTDKSEVGRWAWDVFPVVGK